MARKNTSGWVLPQIIDPPRKCVKIWIPNEVYHRGAFWGALLDLTQAYNWQQDPPETARAVANLWFDIWLQASEDNNMNGCCDDPQVTYRIDPATGQVQQSTTGGSVWSPAAGGFPSLIVEPIPPVTSGVSATKCDAATNLSGQVQVWIDQVSNDFTTATSLLEFGLAVVAAVAAAVLLVLTGGALLPAEALFLSTIGAALVAAWGAGKTVFDDYWTTDIKDKILCAAFCHIGADGSFSDAQSAAFWNEVNSKLPPSPAKMLFMGFLSSVGRQGLNAMAASGMQADADCADCVECQECNPSFYANYIWVSGVRSTVGTVVASDDTSITLRSYDRGDGQQVMYIAAADGSQCCKFSVEFIGDSPSSTLHSYNTCGEEANYLTLIPDDTSPFGHSAPMFGLQMSPNSAGWVVKWTFTP